MRNIEEFIDQQVLRDSKEIEFINSSILETVEKTEEQEKENANAGNAAEYLTVISFAEQLQKSGFEVVTFPDISFASYMAIKFTKNSKKEKNTYKEVKEDTDEFVNQYINTTFFRKNFLNPDYIFDNNKINLKLKKILVKHTGQELSGISSADIAIYFIYNNPDLNSSKDLRQELRISLKRGNKKIYGSSKFSLFTKKTFDPTPSKSNDEINQELSKTNLISRETSSEEEKDIDKIFSDVDADIVKQKGGGPLKIFEIFGFDYSNFSKEVSEITESGGQMADLLREGIPLFLERKELLNKKQKSEETLERIEDIKDILDKNSKLYNDHLLQRRKNIIYLYKEFRKYLQEKYSFDLKLESTVKIFNIFINLITRSDKSVETYVDLTDPSSAFNYPIVKRYLGHIKKITIGKVYSDENPSIKFSIKKDDIKSFEKTQIRSEKTFSNEFYKKIYELGQSLNRLHDNSKEAEKNSSYIRDYKNLLSIFNLDNRSIDIGSKEELKSLFNTLQLSVESEIKNLESSLFMIGYKFYPIKTYRQKIVKILKKKPGEDDAHFSVASLAFKKFTASMNKLYELSFSEDLEVKKILELIDFILKNTSPSKPKETIATTTESIINSLILEKMNEKEYSKVMKKVSSSGAKGLISAVPSNKTANTIAVRFDADESIDSGIKKVKSSLRSSGYELEDKRVLKFDQNRDTTDVIKNGEVVARLFFRADIKERKGLAYEHIIGAVLTKKITPQLKNRIDLPPDASKEQVMEKLRSEEFGKLFKSAKKAAPLITQKVGNIISAESVGSTNNKADFVLKTDQGKTIGLSAKYATGEKDNEYKMNKVLGFGTEEDSLVYNPKGIPWWIVGRKTFLKKLKNQTSSYGGREYNPDPEDLDAPAWMKTAKESNPDIYKETMEEVYAAIRNILASNLKKLGLKGLIAFANEADLGKEEERQNYDMFLKVIDGPSGLSVTEINLNGIETDGIEQNINIDQIVVQDRSDIIIKIPNHDELKINSVKFKSDMLSSKAGDLKIKTR